MGNSGKPSEGGTLDTAESRPPAPGSYTATNQRLKDTWEVLAREIAYYTSELDERMREILKPHEEPMDEQTDDPRYQTLMDFLAWATCQDGKLTLGAKHNAAPAVEALQQYLTDRPPGWTPSTS